MHRQHYCQHTHLLCCKTVIHRAVNYSVEPFLKCSWHRQEENFLIPKQRYSQTRESWTYDLAMLPLMLDKHILISSVTFHFHDQGQKNFNHACSYFLFLLRLPFMKTQFLSGTSGISFQKAVHRSTNPHTYFMQFNLKKCIFSLPSLLSCLDKYENTQKTDIDEAQQIN